MAMKRLAPFALLALVVTIPCWPVLLAGSTFFYRDVFLHYVPQKTLVASLVGAGHLPIWDPFLHGGQPLWASLANVVFHPSTLAFVVFPPALAFGVETAAHFALAAVGACGLARSRGLEWPGALTAGAAFALSGVTVSLVAVHPSFLGLAPLPAVLWAWDAWLRGASSRVLAAVTALAALVACAGAAESAMAGAALVLAWTFAAGGARPLRTRLGALVLCGVVALAIAAPSWLPALDMVRSSGRGAGFGWNEATTWSLHPLRLIELLVPGMLGRIDAGLATSYWGRGLEANDSPYLGGISIGPICLVLALVGALARSALPRAIRGVLAGLIVVSFALALGRHLPCAEALKDVLRAPVRFPVKFLFAAALPLALLAGAGLDVAVRRTVDARPSTALAKWTLAIVAAGLGVVAVLLRAVPGALGGAVHDLLLLPADFPAPLAGLAAAFTTAALLAAGGCACLALAGRDRTWRAGGALLVALVVAGLLETSLSLLPTTSRAMIETPPGILPVLRESVGGGRLFRDWRTGPHVISFPDDDVAHSVRSDLDSLAGYAAARYGIPVIYHLDYDGLLAARLGAVGELVRFASWEARHPWLATAGVRAVLTESSIDAPGYAEVDLSKVEHPHDLRLYAVVGAASTLRFVPELVVVPNLDAALVAAGDPSRDPARQAVVVGDAEVPHVEGCSGRVEPPDLAHAPGQEAIVDAGCDGTVVLALAIQHGLEVRVDGRSASLFPVDVAFCGVRVPKGRHVIDWRYRPRGLGSGLALSCAGLIAMAFIALVPQRE